MLEHGCLAGRFTIFVSLELKATFDTVNSTVLRRCHSAKFVPDEFLPLIQPRHPNRRIQVRAYIDLSIQFDLRSGVR